MVLRTTSCQMAHYFLLPRKCVALMLHYFYFLAEVVLPATDWKRNGRLHLPSRPVLLMPSPPVHLYHGTETQGRRRRRRRPSPPSPCRISTSSKAHHVEQQEPRCQRIGPPARRCPRAPPVLVPGCRRDEQRRRDHHDQNQVPAPLFSRRIVGFRALSRVRHGVLRAQ